MSKKFIAIVIALTLFLSLNYFNSKAAIYYSRATGNWNSTSSWSTASYSGSAASSCPGSSSGDVVLISGYTITVTATPTNAITSLTVSQSNSTGNDTKLYINTSGVTLTGNSLTVTENNLSKNVDVEVAQGILQINGNVAYSRSSSNSQSERLRLYVSNTGRVNITGNLTYTLNRAQNNNSAGNEIQIDNTARLDITGNLSATVGNSSGNSNQFDFQMNNSAVCNIGGNASFTVSNTNDGDDLMIDINGGTLAITGTMSATVVSTATSGNSVFFYIDGATVTTGAFTFVQSGGSSGDMELKLNSSLTTTAASLSVTGTLLYTHNDGDNMEIEMNTNATLTITQDLNLNITTSSDGDNIYLDFNGGTVNAVNAYLSISSGATSGNYLYFDVDGTTVNFTGNVRFNQGGGDGSGDIDFYINSNSTTVASNVTVGGNLTFMHSKGDNYEIELNNNSALTVSGNLIDTLSSTDGDDFYIDINGGTFTVNQNFNHIQQAPGGTAEDLNIRMDGSGKFNINGDVYIDQEVGGQVSIYTNYSTGSTAEFNVLGNFTLYHAAAADGIYLEADQSSRFTVAGNFLIDNYAASGDNARLRMNNSSTVAIGGNFTMNLLSGSTSVADYVEVDMNGGTMTVGGNMTMNSSSGNDAIITIDGNSTSLTVSGTLKLQHSGGDDNYITIGNGSGSPTVTLGALSLDDSGGDITYCRVYNSSVLNVTGNITLTALAASQVDIGLYNTSQIKVGGNFIRNATPSRYGVLSCATGSTVEYNGTSQQTIAGDAGSGTDNFTYGNIKLNNVAGFTMSSTEGNLTIPASTTLTFTNGVVNSSTSAFIIIAHSASVAGACNSSYVNGPIRKVGNSAFTFPIGCGGNYQPATISAPSGSTHYFTAQYFSANPGNSYNSGSLSGIDHISKCEYWYINRENSTTNVTVTLTFDAGSCGVTDLSALRIARWDGSQWVNQGNGGTTGNTSAGTIVNSITVSSYLTPNSPFTLASSNSSNPLPVELVNFTAEANDTVVNIDWATASETDNNYFEIERSANGENFESIAKIKGQGNSNVMKKYNWIDQHPLSGISYYRLRQFDFNGTTSTSDIRSVDFKKTKGKQEIIVFPNPSSETLLHVSIKYNSDIGFHKFINAQLFDETGKLIFADIHLKNENENSFELDLKTKPDAGIYLLKLNELNGVHNQLIVFN